MLLSSTVEIVNWACERDPLCRSQFWYSLPGTALPRKEACVVGASIKLESFKSRSGVCAVSFRLIAAA